MEEIRGHMSLRLFTMVLLALPALSGAEDPLSRAEERYQLADYRASLALVRESGQTSGRAYCLAGRDHFMLGDYKQAAQAFERASSLEPANSVYAGWLGRSYGRRAETSSPFFAPKYVAKAHTYLEKAVALDPQSDQVLHDLFDYYLEAPGFLAGGFDKAEEIAKRIAGRNPGDGQLAEARLADRRKQFDSVEEQLRRVIDPAVRSHRGGHRPPPDDAGGAQAEKPVRPDAVLKEPSGV
jgi:tetratricopeptide (TPR) repeat protein